MAGQAKYTNYAPIQKDLTSGGSTPPSMGKANYTLLNTLFGTRPDAIPLTNNVSDLEPIMKRANDLLNPPVADTSADPMWWPKGVYLNFLNPAAGMSAPDIQNLDISKVGDGGPSTPYTPNLTSTDTTGAGKTDPVAAYVMTTAEIQPTLAIGADNGTANPSVTSLNMFQGNKLGTSTLLPGFRPGRTLPER